MAYNPPNRSNINFIVTNNYTIPIRTEINFVLSDDIGGSTLEFIFIEENYVAPDYNDLLFWFGASIVKAIPASILHITTNKSCGILSDINSSLSLASSVIPQQDTIIDIEPSILTLNSIVVPNSNTWVLYSIPSSILRIVSYMYYGKDQYYNIPASVLSLNSSVDFVSDKAITIPASILSLNENINASLTASINSTLITTSNSDYNKLINKTLIISVNIGRITKELLIVNQINDTLNTSLIIKNGIETENNLVINNAILVDNTCSIINDITVSVDNSLIIWNSIDIEISNNIDIIITNYLESSIAINNDLIEITDNSLLISNQLSYSLEKELELINGLLTESSIDINNSLITTPTNELIIINDLATIIDIEFFIKNAICVDSIISIDNSIINGIQNSIDISYDLIESVSKEIDIVNDINSYNELGKLLYITNVIDDSASVTYNNSLEAKVNGELIHIIDFTIQNDDDSYCSLLSCQVQDIDSWMLCMPDSEIILTINSIEFKFIIDSRTRTREWNSDNYEIEARSKSSVLGNGNNVVTKTWDSVSSYQVIQELLTNAGVSYTCDILNWPIAKNILSLDKESPIEAINKICEACGGLTISNPDGSLHITNKFNGSPLLYKTSIESFFDYKNIFNVSESKDITSKWNAVTVSDIQDEQNYSYNISEISDSESNDIKHLRVKVYPFLERIDLLTSYISSDILIVSEDNPITEIITDEIVEIVEGVGTASDSIKNILTYEYLNTNLGSLSFTNNQITTQIDGQSLIKLSYVTEYHDFHVISNNVEVAQFYTTDENEVI